MPPRFDTGLETSQEMVHRELNNHRMVCRDFHQPCSSGFEIVIDSHISRLSVEIFYP